MAEHGRSFAPTTVAGPTTGGVLLAYEVARQLGVRGIVCETDEAGGRSFQRGFKLQPGEKVMIVDDIVTTGGSLVESSPFYARSVAPGLICESADLQRFRSPFIRWMADWRTRYEAEHI